MEVSVARALEICDRVILVTGHRGGELEELFHRWSPQVVCVRNHDYAKGMFSSIRTGAALLRAPRFFISHADMPEIPAQLYRRLLSLLDERATAEMARPVCGGQPGHPVLCRLPVAQTIREEPPESHMQAVMGRHVVVELEVAWGGCIYDVDEPADLEGPSGDR